MNNITTLTPNTLVNIPMADKEFTRFLKERKIYHLYIKAMKDEDNKQFRISTLTNKLYLNAFIKNKEYIYHGLPLTTFGWNWIREIRNWSEFRLKHNLITT